MATFMLCFMISRCRSSVIPKITITDDNEDPALRDRDANGNIICDEGYWYDKEEDFCDEIRCICDHGKPVQGFFCTEHLAHECQVCDLGYYLDDDSICKHMIDEPRKRMPRPPPLPEKVCRNKDVGNLTIVAWTATKDFQECTDLLMNTRVGRSGDEGLKAIAASMIRLGSKSKLKRLFLAGSAISDEGVLWLAAALGGKFPPKQEDDGVEVEDREDISDTASSENADDPEELAKSYDEAQRQATLEVVGHVQMPTHRGNGIAPLEFLLLHMNRVTDVGAGAIAEALKENTFLNTVHLSENSITEVGLDLLVDVITSKKNRHVEQLVLEGNQFDITDMNIQKKMRPMRRILDNRFRSHLSLEQEMNWDEFHEGTHSDL